LFIHSVLVLEFDFEHLIFDTVGSGLNNFDFAHFFVVSDDVGCVRKLQIIAFRIRLYLVYRFSPRPEIRFRKFDHVPILESILLSYKFLTYSLVLSPTSEIKRYILPKEGLSLLGFVTRYI